MHINYIHLFFFSVRKLFDCRLQRSILILVKCICKIHTNAD